MKVSILILFALATVSTSWARDTSLDSEIKKPKTSWTYRDSNGPEHWASISPDYSICAEGKEQSPIDIQWANQADTRKLEFHYQMASSTIIDKGYTVQVNVPAGSYAIIDEEKYQLEQFHLHLGSEHTFSGKQSPLEIHFVHKNAVGKLAVVGVMFNSGKKNSTISKIFGKLPTNGQQLKTAHFNPASLLPKVHTHAHYRGSLTTPPCSEGVNWTVFLTPLEISQSQLSLFQSKYKNSFRPVQPLNERTPKSYK